jgi:hypothetical protein
MKGGNGMLDFFSDKKPLTGVDVENRSAALIREFETHFTEYLTYRPEDIDRKREVFESWAIQKIAGLQLTDQYLAEKVRSLEDAVKRMMIG